jgi:polysaccharide export outer membrane protein
MFKFKKVRYNTQYLFVLCLVVFVIITGLSSCGTTKVLTYFQDVVDSGNVIKQTVDTSFYAKVQPGDILGIDVLNINPTAAAPFNMGNVTSTMQSSQFLTTAIGGATMPTAQYSNLDSRLEKGYLVSKDSTIDFVGIGTIKVAGFTTNEISRMIRKPLVEKYLKDETTVVNVKILNYKINIVGEVTRPTTYSIPTSKVSIMDAISMAGDLTPYGNREKVTVIREENGIRTSAILNLKSSKIFQSPYFYLKQNDIVYVAPLKTKEISVDTQTSRFFSISSWISGVLSLAMTVILFARK